MTNKEKLVRDLPLIAQNHGFNCNVEDFLNDEDNPCIFGGCNVPTLADVKMLCKSVGLDTNCVIPSSFGIDIEVSSEWYDEVMENEWVPQYEWWLRADQTTVEL